MVCVSSGDEWRYPRKCVVPSLNMQIRYLGRFRYIAILKEIDH